MPAGTKDVKVGTLIALTVGEGEDWKDVATPGAPSATATSAPLPAQPAFTGGNGTLLCIYSLKWVVSVFGPSNYNLFLRWLNLMYLCLFNC